MDLADWLGLSSNHVCRVERGRRPASRTMLRLLATFFRCEISDLTEVPSELRLAEIKLAFTKSQFESAAAELEATKTKTPA